MSDDQLCVEILNWLATQGFGGVRLSATGFAKSPDIEAHHGDERYLIEVKEKGDDPAVVRVREQALDAGEVADFSESFARRNTLDGIFERAARQLAARAGQDQSVFRFIWFECTGTNPDAQIQQITSTAYGSCRIIELRGPSWEGYYVRSSAFVRHRDDLDGVIVSDGDGGKLLINCRSPRASTVRACALVRLFGDATVDPEREEASGEALIADCDLPRRDEGPVVQYLQRKYGKGHLIAMEMGLSAGLVRRSS